MPSSDSSREALLERLSEEFVERHRRGERPALSEYAERHPELAADIRDLFPALVKIEHLKPVAGDLTGAFVPTNGPAPEQLGEFRILREVGRGGMGIVYEAEQESLGRHVALKVLPPHSLDNPVHLERFRREARAAGRLHHTNIVPVYGVGETQGVHYYAMQFIQGEGLDKVLRDLRRLRNQPALVSSGATPDTIAPDGSELAQSLLTGRFALPEPAPAEEAAPVACAVESPPTTSSSDASHSSMSGSQSDWRYCRTVARLGLQVADALAYAHRQSILHRDIKPSNLLLDQQGTIWITDFGLAKSEGGNLTQLGEIVGTLRYMAPERFNGQSLKQSDLYSLGLTLYEMLTLRPAFDDPDRMGLIDKQLHDTPTPPRRLEPRIPRDLETIIMTCLAKEPTERYKSAEALAEDLRLFLADRPIKVRRTPWHERTWRWCRRNPAVATLSAASFGLLLLLAVGGIAMSLRLNDALGQASEDRDKARDEERERKKQLFQSLVSDARARRFSGRVGQRFGTLESIRRAAVLAREMAMPPETFEELRDLAISALALPDIHMVHEWEGWPEGTRNLVFDDRMELYARDDKFGNISVRRVADDVEVAQQRGGEPNFAIQRFDEGDRALVLFNSTDQSTKRWRFDTRPHTPTAQHHEVNGENVWTATTADKQLLVSLNLKNGCIAIHEMATGKHLHDIRFGKWAEPGDKSAEPCQWAMHPWRHELAVWMGHGNQPQGEVLRVLDLDRGTIQQTLQTGGPTMGWSSGRIIWHPDGRTLFVGCFGDVSSWDVPSGKRVRGYGPHQGGGIVGSMNNSGQLLCTYSTWAGGVKFWHPHTGRLLLNMPGLSMHPSVPSPDGRLYTYERKGTHLQLWAAEPSPIFRILLRSPALGQVGEYRANSVHRNGRLLAVARVCCQ